MEKEEIVELLENSEDEIFGQADIIRKKYCGDKVYLRGIIEFSNCCCRDCLYCGLRCSNQKIKRYRISPAEIIELANGLIAQGISTIVLQSGDDFGYSRQTICKIISEIKKLNSQTAITLSIGERPFDDYRAFKDAGADRYLLKQETANPVLYEKLHPQQTLKERLAILDFLKKIGFQTGSGNIVGLPGQTLQDLAEDILLFKKLAVGMIGIGPFIPQEDTPLANYPAGDLKLALKVISLTRIITLNTYIPATTALSTIDQQNGLLLGLKAGANVIMPNFTPSKYAFYYQIYDNKAEVSLEKVKEVIKKAQREISFERADIVKS